MAIAAVASFLGAPLTIPQITILGSAMLAFARVEIFLRFVERAAPRPVRPGRELRRDLVPS